MGQLTFTEMMFFGILGRRPNPQQVKVVDACLVTLMEHGLTPSALTTRLVYSSAPEAMQGAVAAGLSCVGSVFVGTMEACGLLLKRMLHSERSLAEEARAIAAEHRAERKPLPGFGHPQHKPDDPRSIRLFEIAESQGLANEHVAAARELGRAVDQVYGKHITLNATGAIAALLGDCDVPYEIMRGFAIVARSAGLVAHVHEEQSRPTMSTIWHASEQAIIYDGAEEAQNVKEQ